MKIVSYLPGSNAKMGNGSFSDLGIKVCGSGPIDYVIFCCAIHLYMVRKGFGTFRTVVEIDDAILQDLESFGKEGLDFCLGISKISLK